MIDSILPVFVLPGKILFTVIPKGASSSESVFDQLAIAPRTVFETPNPLIGIFTDVDMILIILPVFTFFHRRYTCLNKNLTTN